MDFHLMLTGLMGIRGAVKIQIFHKYEAHF